jgi:hypothetical protein
MLLAFAAEGFGISYSAVRLNEADRDRVRVTLVEQHALVWLSRSAFKDERNGCEAAPHGALGSHICSREHVGPCIDKHWHLGPRNALFTQGEERIAQ